MNIYEKLEAIEKSIISLAGDKTTDGKPDGKLYITLEKMEKELKPFFQKYNLFLKKEVTKSTSSCSTYQQENQYKDSKNTQTKVMYFVDVEVLFTFIDTKTGETTEFKFCGSDNKITNAGQCFSSAVSYARRNFYKTIFNIEIGSKDEILKEQEELENKNITTQKETWDGEKYSIQPVPKNPIGPEKAKILKKGVLDLYGQVDGATNLELLKTNNKVYKLEQLEQEVFEKIISCKFDLSLAFNAA